MRTTLSLALTLILASAASMAVAGSTVWKWVDEKGVTHYSDQPVPGATKMELNSSSNRSDSNAAPSSYTPPAESANPPVQKGPAYARFVVDQPAQDEAIINTGGIVRIGLAATPAIAAGQLLSVYLDGARIEDFPPTSMSHTLTNVPRGTHTLRAVVSTLQGAPIQETPPVTFHVRQESVAQPPVGPALRNPPRPRPNGASNKMRTTQPTYSALNGGAATIDPQTNMPVVTKPLPAGPKAGPNVGK